MTTNKNEDTIHVLINSHLLDINEHAFILNEVILTHCTVHLSSH
ncbi:hypothetical protein [Rickettsiella grylli]|nr:hypothetical protein [Rickettsiella grylli]